MGTNNLRRGMLSLQTDLKALVWAMQNMHNKRTIIFKTNCSDVVKMVASPNEWLAFLILLEEVAKYKQEFSSCFITSQ